MSDTTACGESRAGPIEQLRARLLSRIDQLSGHFATTWQTSTSSRRLSNFMRQYDARSERAVAAAQGAIALFILILHIGARIGKDQATVNPWVVGVLVALVASSMLRAHLSRRPALPDRLLNVLNVADVTIFLLLIWSYQFAYEHPAGGVLKAPSISILFVLVALRALRFHPVPLIVTGCTAAFGWLALLLVAIGQDGTESITRDYLAYLTGHKILIGAEVEKLVALISLVAFLAFATYRARRGLLQLDETLEHMPHGVSMFDSRNRLVICNSLYGDIYGLTNDDVKPGTSIQELVAKRQESGIYGSPNKTPDFASDWVSDFNNATARIQELADGRTLSIRRKRKPDGGMITSTVDITDRRQLEARIEHMAYHDGLTGLANRLHLLERLEKMLAGRRTPNDFTVFCLDLDHFKHVNDTLGHHIGDTLLRAVADRLRDTVRDSDLVARTGGDEFIIVQPSTGSTQSATALAARIIEVVGAPYHLFGHHVDIGVSVGIALSGDETSDAGELIKQADLALYRAKEEGRGVFRFFEAEMNERLQARLRMERDLRKALSNGEFELYYQPVVGLDQNKITGVEALLRWHHPERGTVSPGEFIPLVEEIGLASPLGGWVINQACSDAANWPDEIKVAVNVSAAQFRKPGLVDTVANALDRTGLMASRLEIEITETALLEDSETTIRILDQLRVLGVRIAMDDFGTGYASLSYLQKFPFDRIKIDRSFIDEINKDGNAGEIVKAVISLSKGLGMSTTAEGIETREQFDTVSAEGCTDIQGFLISRPKPRGEIEDLFEEFGGNSKSALV
ncbi:MAG: putative bifunctional diguanylate cyclase/phosphodiesterase [Hyphomicrobiaceae bacterium]